LLFQSLRIMVDKEHPITPPQWQMDAWQACIETMGADVPAILLEAVRWGADQALEACCEWMAGETPPSYLNVLRNARRPKPPSLKEQALTALHAIATGANDIREQHQDFDTIRKALEQLDDE